MGLAIHSAVFGVLVPIVASAIVIAIHMFVLTSPNEEETKEPSRFAWFGGLAVVFAYAAGQIGMLQFPSITSNNSIPRLFWLAFLTVLLSFTEVTFRWPTALRWLLRVALLSLTGYLMFGGMVASGSWTSTQAITNLSSMVVGASIVWFALEQSVSKQADIGAAWLLMVYGIGLSVVLALAESVKLAQLSGTMVSGIGLWWVASWFGKRQGRVQHLAPSVLVVFVFLSFGLASMGKFEANLTVTSAILLVVPSVLLFGHTYLFAGERTLKQIAIQTALILLPIVIAGALLLAKSPPPKGNDDAYDPYSSIVQPVLSILT